MWVEKPFSVARRKVCVQLGSEDSEGLVCDGREGGWSES